jgi:hypothetical protein
MIYRISFDGGDSPDALRSFGEDLKTVADELTAPPEAGDTTHRLTETPPLPRRA